MAADRVALDNFGYSVALDGNRLVVGTPDTDPLGNKSGAAYVFRRTGGIWSQEVKLVTSNGSNGDTFGTAVDISGDSVLVGAPGANAVYVFTRLGGVWTETTILTATTPAGSSKFGSSIAIANEAGAIVGAVIGDPGEDSKGAAYVFGLTFIGWQQVQRIVASNGVNGAAFGSSVGVSAEEDRAIVGAPFQNAAYIYDSLELLIKVTIDIQPRDSSNVIGGRRGILIAILSEAGFKPTQDVDKSSLRFGQTGTENSRQRCGRRFGRGDFNGDGVDDLLCSFKFAKTGLAVGDTTGVLRGQLNTGRSIGGNDGVTVR